MANLNLSQFGENTSVSDADYTFVWDSAASISKKVSRNSWLNSGTLTSSAPVTISQTWNNAAVGFNALVVNAAGTSGTNSASGSLLLNLQVNTASAFFVRKDGAVYGSSNAVFASSVGVGLFGSTLSFYAGVIGGGRSAVSIADGWSYAFSSGAQAVSSQDVFLTRDAPNTLALRNSTAAQTFNVYGTWTTAITNFERLAIKYNTTDVAYQIAAEKGTTNGDYRPLQLWTGGASRLHITTAGNVGIGTTDPDNALTVRSTTNNVNGVGQLILLSSDALAADKGGRFGLAGIYDNVNGRALFAEVAGLKENATSGNWAGYLTLRTRAAGGAITDRLRIDSVGNVGIGTTAPTSGLHISGPLGTDGGTYNSSAAIKLTNTTTNNSWLITSGLVGVANAHFSIRRESIALPALVIAGITDNVGIGTTSPTSKLHVAGELGTNITTFDSGAAIKITNTTATGKSWLLTSGIINVHNEFFCIRQETINQTALSIAPTSNNVGIGINSATSKLTVSGGDVEVFSIASGLILKSPDGTRYRITVPNGGASLTITAV